MNKEKALKVILEAAKQYNKNLVNNNLLFVSCDKHSKITFFESAWHAVDMFKQLFNCKHSSRNIILPLL